MSRGTTADESTSAGLVDGTEHLALGVGHCANVGAMDTAAR